MRMMVRGEKGGEEGALHPLSLSLFSYPAARRSSAIVHKPAGSGAEVEARAAMAASASC
jgi:hypothetical protein